MKNSIIFKHRLYKPYICTIPDDMAVFSILDLQDATCMKIVMENYINLYAFKEPTFHNIVFRFENFMNYESIRGLDHCFIPMKIIKRNPDKIIEIIKELLMDGYVMTLPVNRASIDFYGKNAKGIHMIFVYGINELASTVFCKDFKTHEFTEFEISYKDMKKSIMQYEREYKIEEDGLLAIKISKTIESEIEYSKAFSEFSKLNQEFYTNKSAFGMGALDLFIEDVTRYPREYLEAERWFHPANYLREMAKLMLLRFQIINRNDSYTKMNNEHNNEEVIKKLLYDTGNLFTIACNKYLKNTDIQIEEMQGLLGLIDRCKVDYKEVIKLFCGVISDK